MLVLLVIRSIYGTGLFLSFAKMMGEATFSLSARIVSLSLAGIASVFTYHLIEKPIRFSWRSRSKIAILIFAIIVIGVFGKLAHKKIIEAQSSDIPFIENIELRPDYPLPPGVIVDDDKTFASLGMNTKRAVLMIGDSHTAMYRLTLFRIISEAQRLNPTIPRAMFSLDFYNPGSFEKILPKITRDSSIESVVISSFWALIYGSEKINYSLRCCRPGTALLAGGAAYLEPPPENVLKKIDDKLESTIRELIASGRKVYVVLDIPFGEEFIPQLFVERSLLRGVRPLTISENNFFLSKAQAIERAEPIRSRVAKIALRAGAKLIDPVDELCPNDKCLIRHSNGYPVYKDYDHLSQYSSQNLIHYLDFLFK